MNILILGATGRLGRFLTLECLKYNNLNVNIFIRDVKKDTSLVEAVRFKGGKVYVGDLGKEDDYYNVTQGIHTVVSCLRANAYEYQMNVLRDAIRNGVERYVPANYSVIDCSIAPKGFHKVIDERIDFNKELDKAGIKALNVINGIFHEFLLEVNDFEYYGSGDEEIPMISYSDTAKYIAAALSKNISGYLYIYVEKLTLNQISELYENIVGKKLNFKRKGNLEEGKRIYLNYIKEGNINEYIITLGFFILIYEGYVAKTNQANQFPEVIPDIYTSDYLRCKLKHN